MFGLSSRLHHHGRVKHRRGSSGDHFGCGRGSDIGRSLAGHRFGLHHHSLPRPLPSQHFHRLQRQFLERKERKEMLWPPLSLSLDCILFILTPNKTRIVFMYIYYYCCCCCYYCCYSGVCVCVCVATPTPTTHTHTPSH